MAHRYLFHDVMFLTMISKFAEKNSKLNSLKLKLISTNVRDGQQGANW